MNARPCSFCGAEIQRPSTQAAYCGRSCRQKAFVHRRRTGAVAPRGPRGVYLDDVLHLMRYGARLSEVAARLGVYPTSILKAVDRAGRETPEGLVEADVAYLRRLVSLDQQRTRDEAVAEHSRRLRAQRDRRCAA